MAPTVTFNANGGTGTMAPLTSTTPRALTPNAFTRTGYTFTGWNTAANGSGTAYADLAIYPFASSATLYARWVVRPNVTVTFNANGGTGTMANQTANVPTALTANAFTRSTFAFSGWNTAADGSGTPYADGAVFPFSAATTLYARWVPVGTRTVTFDANGGTGTMAVQTASSPTALRLNAFTRDGFTFTAWNTAADGTGTAYANGATYSFASNATLYARWTPAKPPAWSRTGSMGTARRNHATVLLANGKVLVAGGQTSGGGYLSSAEVYDPATGTWAPTGSMSTTRSNFPMVLLPSGKVLAVGGYGSGGTRGFKASADLYDPATGTWSSAGSVTTPRSWTTATLLPTGKVLVAGGDADGLALKGSRLYDPVTNTWTATADMPVAMYGHAAVLLANGKVLVTAGRGQPNGGAPVRDSALYDPATGTWSVTGALSVTRATAMVTLLPDGRVLAAGGVSGGGTERSTAELYDPATGVWTPTGSMAAARRGAAIAVLADGRVLVAGGRESEYLAASELYDPATGVWTTTAAMLDAREPKRTAVRLGNGNVLVVGGYNDATGYLNGAELYNPRPK